MPFQPVKGKMRLLTNKELEFAIESNKKRQFTSLLDKYWEKLCLDEDLEKSYSISSNEGVEIKNIVSVDFDVGGKKKVNFRIDLQKSNANGDANMAFQIGDETVACWFLKKDQDYDNQKAYKAIKDCINRSEEDANKGFWFDKSMEV